MREYPSAYTGEDGQIPYYAIMNDENNALYNRYVKLVEGYKNFHLLGRLAEYKYYNIDGIVDKALKLANELVLSL
jgi:UDP-galactopyranose mutase